MAYISFQPSDYFNTKLYTGNGSTQSITGVGFQPDWVWIKNRSSAYSHQAYDAVRGSTKKLLVDGVDAEATDANGLTSFDSDGFSLGTNIGVNENTSNHVAWNWLANGSGSSNSDGSISSTVSANTTSGFSIVKWTGSGANATIGHGLGAVPKWIWVKSLNNTTWHMIYHVGTGNDSELGLNSTNAASASSTAWQDTDPTTSVFYVGGSAGDGVNYSGDYVAYCFAEKKGFSKFGSYTGNGNADGTFVYTGFKPAFVMVKKSSASGDNWSILDNKRNTFNVMDKYLDPNSSNAEGTADIWDFTSNGFKMRNTFSGYNASGATFIFMAFAEHPLVSSNDIPATAR